MNDVYCVKAEFETLDKNTTTLEVFNEGPHASLGHMADLMPHFTEATSKGAKLKKIEITYGEATF